MNNPRDSREPTAPDAADDAQPVTGDELMERFARSDYAWVLQDEAAALEAIYTEMSRSPDKVLREMGHELLAGRMTPQGLLEVEAYRDVLATGFRTLETTDWDGVAAQLDELGSTDSSGDRPAAAQPDPGSPEDDPYLSRFLRRDGR